MGFKNSKVSPGSAGVGFPNSRQVTRDSQASDEPGEDGLPTIDGNINVDQPALPERIGPPIIVPRPLSKHQYYYDV
jgi:hypothetical protein